MAPTWARVWFGATAASVLAGVVINALTAADNDGGGFHRAANTFTFIRGAIVHWYPYPFIDVTRIGYRRAVLDCVPIPLFSLALAAAATVLDSRLGLRRALPDQPRR